MMQRNLDRRVEALVPITDPRLKHRIEEIIEIGLADDVLAWQGNTDGSWTKAPETAGIDTHQQLLDLAASRARGESSYPS